MYVPYAFDSSIVSNTPDEKILYRLYIENFGPYLWIENYAGVGFNLEIYNNWFLTQRIGFGGYSVIGDDARLASNYSWEFGGLLSAGIVYKLKR